MAFYILGKKADTVLRLLSMMLVSHVVWIMYLLLYLQNKFHQLLLIYSPTHQYLWATMHGDVLGELVFSFLWTGESGIEPHIL